MHGLVGSHELEDPDGTEPVSPRNQAGGFCQDFPLLAQPPVLTFQPPQLFALGTGQSFGSPACIAIGLRDPVPDRLRRRLELT